MLKVLEAEDSMSKKQWTNKAMAYRFSVSKSVSSQYISLWHPGMSSEYIYTITSLRGSSRFLRGQVICLLDNLRIPLRKPNTRRCLLKRLV